MALLRPKEWIEKPIEEHMKFILDAEYVMSLIDQCSKFSSRAADVIKSRSKK